MLKRAGAGLGSVAFDAAYGSGLAYLASQLELPDVKLIEPLASVTHPRDIPITTGGGFPESLSRWASDYGTAGGNQYGLQGTENTDIPMVQVDVRKGEWKTFIWQASMLLSYLDMERLLTAKRQGMPMPFSIQDLLDKGVRLIWNKALDRVTYLGWAGQPGLCNNSAIGYTLAANGAAGSPLWANKTTTEILNDFNTILLATQQASGYDVAGMADTCLVDYEHYDILTQPMTIGGFNSLLEWILANNIAKRQGINLEIYPLPDPWIVGQGQGSASTNRMVAYRKNDETLKLHIPQPIQKVMTVPSVKDGGSYETLFNGCVGQVQVFRSTAAAYLDNI
jgi:hypothetical protein